MMRKDEMRCILDNKLPRLSKLMDDIETRHEQTKNEYLSDTHILSIMVMSRQLTEHLHKNFAMKEHDNQALFNLCLCLEDIITGNMQAPGRPVAPKMEHYVHDIQSCIEELEGDLKAELGRQEIVEEELIRDGTYKPSRPSRDSKEQVAKAVADLRKRGF